MQTIGKEIIRNLYLSESLAIPSLVVEVALIVVLGEETCFLVNESGVNGELFLFRYFFRQGDNLVDVSGVKGAPFLFRYLFGSFDDSLLYSIMSRI